MYQFNVGEKLNPVATLPVKPAGLSCTAELYLVSDSVTAATSEPVAFTSTGSKQSLQFSITMPDTEGRYKPWLDVFTEGIFIAGYQGIEIVEIILPIGWVPCVTDITVPTAQDLVTIENYEYYLSIGISPPYELAAAYSAVQLWLGLKVVTNTFITRGEILSNVVARIVGYRGGDTNYWAYAGGYVPRGSTTWGGMALAMALIAVSQGTLMYMPDGSRVVATEELVQIYGPWDVIVGFGAAGAVVITVRTQIDTWKDLLARMGWCFIDP